MSQFDNPIFHDDEAARLHLESLRWPDGAVCPHCGVIGESTRLEGKKHRPGVYKCNACRKQYTVTVGTVFERSKVPLHKWMLAVYLLCSSKKGISAHQLMRHLGVQYKTAWFMAHRIREAMNAGGVLPKLGGCSGTTVEVDETFWSQTPGTRVQRGGGNKMKVFSMVERGGDVRSYHVPNLRADTLCTLVKANVEPGTLVCTDEARQYKRLIHDFPHEVVAHEYGEYSRGEVYTNTIEGFFSIFKRGMTGV